MKKNGSRKNNGRGPHRSKPDLMPELEGAQDESFGSMFSDLEGLCASLQNSTATERLPSISIRGHGVHAAFQTHATVGLILDGCVVKSIVFGGPAHLSRQLDQGDIVVKVDHEVVSEHTIISALEGDDVPGSSVTLEVKKADEEGELRSITLQRVSSPSACDKLLMFDLCTCLKESAAESMNERMSSLVDQCISLWSRAATESQERETEMEEMRHRCNHLSQNLIAKVTGLREALSEKEQSLSHESKRSVHEMVSVKASKNEIEQQIKKSKRKIRDIIALADVNANTSADDSLDALHSKLEACVRSITEQTSGAENQEWCHSNLENARSQERIQHLETQLRKAIEASVKEQIRADKLSDVNKALLSQLGEARQSSQQAEQDLRRAEDQAAELKASLDAVRDDLESSEQNQSKILSATDTLKRDLEEESNTSRRLQELHLEAERTNGRLYDDISEARRQQAEAAHALQRAETETEGLRKAVRELQAEKRGLEEQVLELSTRQSSLPSWSNAPSEVGDAPLPTTVFSQRTKSEEASQQARATGIASQRWDGSWEVREAARELEEQGIAFESAGVLIMSAGDDDPLLERARLFRGDEAMGAGGEVGGAALPARGEIGAGTGQQRPEEEGGLGPSQGSGREGEGMVVMLKMRLAEVGREALVEREGRKKVEEELDFVRSQLLVQRGAEQLRGGADGVGADGEGAVAAHRPEEGVKGAAVWREPAAGELGVQGVRSEGGIGAGGGDGAVATDDKPGLERLLSWLGQASMEVTEAKSRLRLVQDGPAGGHAGGDVGASARESDAWLDGGEQTNVSWSLEAMGLAEEAGHGQHEMLPEATDALAGSWVGAFGLWDTKRATDEEEKARQQAAGEGAVESAGKLQSETAQAQDQGPASGQLEGSGASARVAVPATPAAGHGMMAAMSQLESLERSILRVRSEVLQLAEGRVGPKEELARKDVPAGFLQGATEGATATRARVVLPASSPSGAEAQQGVDGSVPPVTVDAGVGVFFPLVVEPGRESAGAEAGAVLESQPAQGLSAGLWGDRCRIAQREAREAKEEAGKLLWQLWELRREKERNEAALAKELERCKSDAAAMGELLAACAAQLEDTAVAVEVSRQATDVLLSVRQHAQSVKAELDVVRKEGAVRDRERGEETSSLREVSEGLKGTLEQQWLGELRLREYLKALETDRDDLVKGLGQLRVGEAALLDMTDAVAGTLETVGLTLDGWVEHAAGVKEQCSMLEGLVEAARGDVVVESGRREAESCKVERLQREVQDCKSRLREAASELHTLKTERELKQRECEELRLELRSAMQRANVMEQSLSTALRAQQQAQVELDALQNSEQEKSALELLREQVAVACYASALMYDAICIEASPEQGKEKSAIVDHGPGPEALADADSRACAQEEDTGGLDAILKTVQKSADQSREGRRKAIELRSEIDKLTRSQRALERDVGDEKRKSGEACKKVEELTVLKEGLEAAIIAKDKAMADAKERAKQWEEEDRRMREEVRTAEAGKREADLAVERLKGRLQVAEHKHEAMQGELKRCAEKLAEEREISRTNEEEAHKAKTLVVNLGARVTGLEQGLEDAMELEKIFAGTAHPAPSSTEAANESDIEELPTNTEVEPKALEAELEAWKASCYQAEEQGKKRRKEVHALKKEAAARKRVTEQLEMQVEGLMEALKTVEQGIASRKREKKAAGSKDGGAQAQEVKGLKGEVAEVKAELEATERELKGFKEELAREKEVGQGVRVALDLERKEREKLRGELESAAGDMKLIVERARREIQALEDRHKEEMGKLDDEKRALGGVCDEVWSDRERLRRECEMLKAELKREESVREEIVRGREEREAAQQRMGAEERKHLAAVQDALLAEREKAALSSAQVTVLEAKVEDLEAERSKALSAMDFEKGERGKVEEELRALEEHGQRRKAVLGEKDKEAGAMRGELEAAREENRILIGQLAVERQEKEEVFAKAEEAKAAAERERERVEAERKGRAEEAERAGSAMRELREEVRSAREEGERRREEGLGLEQSLEGERRTVSELRERVAEMAEKETELAAAVEKRRAEIRKLQQDVAEWEGKCERMSDQMWSITQRKMEMHADAERREVEREEGWERERRAQQREWEGERRVLLRRLEQAKQGEDQAGDAEESQQKGAEGDAAGDKNVVEGWFRGLVDTGKEWVDTGKVLVDSAGKNLVDTGKELAETVPGLGKGLVDTGAGLVGIPNLGKGMAKEPKRIDDGEASTKGSDRRSWGGEPLSWAGRNLWSLGGRGGSGGRGEAAVEGGEADVGEGEAEREQGRSAAESAQRGDGGEEQGQERGDVGGEEGAGNLAEDGRDVQTLMRELREEVRERERERGEWAAERARMQREAEAAGRSARERERELEEGLARERQATGEVRRVEEEELVRVKELLQRRDAEISTLRGMLGAEGGDGMEPQSANATAGRQLAQGVSGVRGRETENQEAGDAVRTREGERGIGGGSKGGRSDSGARESAKAGELQEGLGRGLEGVWEAMQAELTALEAEVAKNADKVRAALGIRGSEGEQAGGLEGSDRLRKAESLARGILDEEEGDDDDGSGEWGEGLSLSLGAKCSGAARAAAWRAGVASGGGGGSTGAKENGCGGGHADGAMVLSEISEPGRGHGRGSERASFSPSPSWLAGEMERSSQRVARVRASIAAVSLMTDECALRPFNLV